MLCGLGLRESVEPKMQIEKNIYSRHVGICHTVTYMAAINYSFSLAINGWKTSISSPTSYLIKKKYPRKSKPVQVGVKTEKNLEHT